MDLFPDGAHVRLKNRVRGTFLSADDDGVGVSLCPDRAAHNAAWEVRLEKNMWDLYFSCILLRSAASGRYLSLAPDHRGRRVAQRLYDEEGGHPGGFMWRAIRTEHGSDEFVVLLHVLGLAVRADDGRINGVAADYLENISEMMNWSVEVEVAPLPPALPELPVLQVGEDGAGDEGPQADADGAREVQEAADAAADDEDAADADADGNQAEVLEGDADADADGNQAEVLEGDADQNDIHQREAAQLYGELENLYQLMERLLEEAREHHRAVRDIKDQAKAMGDWSWVKEALRPEHRALDKIERSYEYRASMASDLRLHLVRLGFPPLEEPDGLTHPGQLRR